MPDRLSCREARTWVLVSGENSVCKQCARAGHQGVGRVGRGGEQGRWGEGVCPRGRGGCERFVDCRSVARPSCWRWVCGGWEREVIGGHVRMQTMQQTVFDLILF